MIDEVSLQDVAASVVDVERSEAFATRSNIVLGATFDKAEDIALFGKQASTHDIRLYRLRNVVLHAFRALLFSNASRIRDTRYLLLDQDYADARVEADNIVFTREAREVVIGYNWVFRNYYHWLIQCVPALYWSVRGADNGSQLLALPELEPWQEEILALLGIAGVDRVTVHRDASYHFERAIYCDFLGGVAAFAVCRSLLEPFAVIKRHASVRPTGLKHLYIARSDTKNRTIANEAEVADFMRSRGFAVVVPGQLPVQEQISLFHAAEVIVGGHGAGLSNVVFAQPGRLVLELLQSDYMNPSMNRLCQVAGVDYRAEVFDCPLDGDEPPRSWDYVHRREWQLDLDILRNAIEQIAPLSRIVVPGADATAGARPTPPAAGLEAAEVLAHVQNVGDVRGGVGAWVGTPGSRRWIEGFCITPPEDIAAEDIECMAVFDHTWSSPWLPAGQFCGCRGASLPIFGFALRLHGAAAGAYDCDYAATFVDGSKVGPLPAGSLCRADTLAPLEAIRIMVRRRSSHDSTVPPAIQGRSDMATAQPESAGWPEASALDAPFRACVAAGARALADLSILVCLPSLFDPKRFGHLWMTVRFLSGLACRRVKTIVLTDAADSKDLQRLRQLVRPISDETVIRPEPDLNDPKDLPWRHKKIIREEFLADTSLFDLFIYLEDDIFLTSENVAYFLAFRQALDRIGGIPSFIRCEYNLTRQSIYSIDQVSPQPILPHQKHQIGRTMFVGPDFPYCAMYIFDRTLAREHLGTRSASQELRAAARIWSVMADAATGQMFENVPSGMFSRCLVPVDADTLRPLPACIVHHASDKYTNLDAVHGRLPLDEVFAKFP